MKGIEEEMRRDREAGISRPQGYYANRKITLRNGGVRHQFQSSIGGCSSNYK